MGDAYSSLSLTKVLYATSLVLLGTKDKLVPAKETKCISCLVVSHSHQKITF